MTKWPLVNVSKENTSWIALDKIFTNQELNEIVTQADQVKKVSSTVGSGAVSDYRVCDIAWLESDEIESDFDWIYATLADAISQANNEHFQFDLTYLTALQYTVYNGNDYSNYQKHLDVGRQFPNRKLSFSVQLSDDAEYTGGDLRFHYIKNQPEVAPRERNSDLFSKLDST
jgi:Rps23 Pro-64 3,4-dihydroxylase Tpa1-like proline 4-hydroxylase